MRRKARLARYAAPLAFLVAATVAYLLVRSGLENGDTTTPPATTSGTTTASATTEPGTTGGTPTNQAGAEFYVFQAGDTLAVIADVLGEPHVGGGGQRGNAFQAILSDVCQMV